MAVYTRGAIEAEIERRKKMIPTPITPVEYQEFMPEVLDSELLDQTQRLNTLDTIDRQGEVATDLALQQVQNQQAYNAMVERRKEANRASRLLRQTRKAQPKLVGPKISGGKITVRGGAQQSRGGNYTGSRNFGRKWGKDNTPEVSDLRRINPNAGLIGMNYRGNYFVVNKQVAPIFTALLDDLWAAGYRPASIGGYSNRNIAGTNTKSLHSYGLAIDIDPNLNPVQYGGTNRNALPKNVAALAAKYGLSWGGSWDSYKDPMHFSVPYGGRE